MTYQEKVQKSKEVLEAIKALEKDKSLKFTFGTTYDSFSGTTKPRVFKINAYTLLRDKLEYAVTEASSFFGLGHSMNVDSITPTTIKLYAYDLMLQKTTYNLPMYEMELQVSTPEQ